jgi:hypothetical protein
LFAALDTFSRPYKPLRIEKRNSKRTSIYHFMLEKVSFSLGKRGTPIPSRGHASPLILIANSLFLPEEGISDSRAFANAPWRAQEKVAGLVKHSEPLNCTIE